MESKLERVNGIEPSFHRKLCKSQQTTLALDLSLLEIGNPSVKDAPKPANDLRWDKHGHVPTSAPSVLKPLSFAPLPAETDSPQSASKEDGRPRF